MDRKGPCMGQLFILPAGLSMKLLSVLSKLPTQSCTGLEYQPPPRSLHPSSLIDSTSTLLGSPVAAGNMQGGFLHRVRWCYIGLRVIWLLHWTALGEPKEPSKMFGLGNPAPGDLSMLQADGKTTFQSAGAKESRQNSSDTQQTSNIPE